MNAINIVEFFSKDEFPPDISTYPVELGGIDFEQLGFTPDDPDGLGGWAV
jgi:hypothetical protein